MNLFEVYILCEHLISSSISNPVKMDGQAESFQQLLQFSVLPIFKVLVMCLLGLLMATSYIDILSSNARKLLSKLVFSVFLPCLIFTQLGSSVTLQKMREWWFIPVNVLMSNILGCGVGVLVALLIRPPPQFFKFTVVMIGIGNIGNVPLVLLESVCHDKENPFGPTCNKDGVAYIAFGQWVGAVVAYTFVLYMLAPPAVPEDDMPIKGTVNGPPEKAAYMDSPMSTPLLDDLEKQEGASCKTKYHVISASFAKIQSVIMQPPIAASILALLFGGIPFLRQHFLEESGEFFFLSDGLNMMGGAMVPCIMLVLGGNLAKGPGASELGLRTTVAITITRLLIVPPMGFSIVLLADKLHLLPPGDKMFRFVLLLQHSMPSSILAGAVASLQGHGEKEASAVLFWEHIFAVVSMACWLMLYLNILF